MVTWWAHGCYFVFQVGFLLPLSGGVDSSSTACIVHSMCVLLCQAIEDNSEYDSVYFDCKHINFLYVTTDTYHICSPKPTLNVSLLCVMEHRCCPATIGMNHFTPTIVGINDSYCSVSTHSFCKEIAGARENYINSCDFIYYNSLNIKGNLFEWE